MKRFIFCLLMWCAVLPAARSQWLNDLTAAQARAKNDGKFLLLSFTGSDWNEPSKNLKAEVFDDREFQAFASTNLVLMQVDFPHENKLDPNLAIANQQLSQAYNVSDFPTEIILDKDGSQVGRLGYVPGGAKAFIAELEKIPGLKPPDDTNDVAETNLTVSSSSATNPAAATAATTTAAGDKAPEPEARHRAPEFVPVPAAPPIRYGPLALKAISGPRGRRLVLINNQTLMEGETASVKSGDNTVEVFCKQIKDDSVLITADGKPMELRLSRPD